MTDGFESLQEAADKMIWEEKGAQAIEDARFRLVLSNKPAAAFFATLALGLRLVPDWGIETMCTDGKQLKYNPRFAAELSAEHGVTVQAHEVSHNALLHHVRRGERDGKLWNEACDCAVNSLLVDAGFPMPDGAFIPGRGQHAALPKGLAAEEYYEKLKQPLQEKEGGGGGDGDGEPQEQPGSDPGGMGGTEEPGRGSPADLKKAEEEQKIALDQAAEAARARGTLPAGLERLIQGILHPEPALIDVLREFVTQKAKQESDWSRPKRRFIHQGIYLPSLGGETLGELVLSMDCSGSIGGEVMQRYANLVVGVIEHFDCTVTILYHDSKVCHVQKWEPDDGPLVLEPKGGGGTSHIPVFDWIAEHELEPVCLLALTDLDSEFPLREPAYPVLWATVGSRGRKGPWGQTVEVE